MGRLGRGELENLVLDVVWRAHGAVTPRDVQEELRATHELAYTTVMTILVRLHRKGLLGRQRAGRAYAYVPLVSREQRAATHMNEALTSAHDPSLALTHFVDALPPDQVDQLRRVLREEGSEP